MATKAGVGISHHRNPLTAAQEAVADAYGAAGIDSADYMMVFSTVGYEQEKLLNEISKQSNCSMITGCSGEGVITSTEADESPFSVGILAISSDDLRFSSGLATGLKKKPRQTGREIAKEIANNITDNSKALFLFTDGINLNYDELKSGIDEGFGREFPLPIVGGAAGDDWKFERTYQYHSGQVVSDSVVWTLMSGSMETSHGVSHGCIPIGVEHIVTKAEGNTIYELDGRTVLDVLRSDYLTEEEMQDWSKTFQTFTLGLKASTDLVEYDKYVIRTMVGGLDEASGSMTIASEVKTGSSLWITSRDFQKLETGIDSMIHHISSEVQDSPIQLIFQFECIGRGKVFLLEEQKLALLGKMRDSFGDAVPWLGFYSYGEIGPIGK